MAQQIEVIDPNSERGKAMAQRLTTVLGEIRVAIARREAAKTTTRAA